MDILSPELVGSIAAQASGLGLAFPEGREGSLAALRRIGSAQIDTISVVERAHHHVLWSRNPDYELSHLDELEAEPRRVFEYWSHAAAYLPIEEYRYCIPRMERIKEQGHEWFRADAKAVAFVRDRIRAEGPLRAQDFEGKRGEGGWWEWKPAKRALEYLFQAGELATAGRRGFQKVYDLAERVLPAHLDRSRPTEQEMAAHYIDRAALSLGVFALGDIAYMRKDGVEGIGAELEARLEEGRLVKLAAAGKMDGPALYAKPVVRGSAASRRRRAAFEEPRAFVLSPFDPLLIDRKRAVRIFGRVYQLECYLPAAKRKFGYFALPILLVGPGPSARLIGRMDAKAERDRSLLAIRHLCLDETGPEDQSRLELAGALARALAEYAAFNGAGAIELGTFEAPDGRLERSLRAALRQALREAPRRAPGAALKKSDAVPRRATAPRNEQ
jgi:Uncharacterized protein conserved in bacteria